MFESLKNDQHFIRSISKELDDFYEGGLHKGIISQIYGEAGSGKTQVAIMYSLGVTINISRQSQETYPSAISQPKNNSAGTDLPLWPTIS